MARIGVAVLLVAAAWVVPAAGEAAAAAPAVMRDCQTVEVTQTVAVHYDPAFGSRVVRTDRRGDQERGCVCC